MLSSHHEVKHQKIAASIVPIEFETAFDSVPIPFLMIKLFNYGVRKNIEIDSFIPLY